MLNCQVQKLNCNTELSKVVNMGTRGAFIPIPKDEIFRSNCQKLKIVLLVYAWNIFICSKIFAIDDTSHFLIWRGRCITQMSRI